MPRILMQLFSTLFVILGGIVTAWLYGGTPTAIKVLVVIVSAVAMSVVVLGYVSKSVTLPMSWTTLLIFIGILLVVLQIVPLPRPVVEIISPQRVALHDELTLGGNLEEKAARLTISFYPTASRMSIALLGVALTGYFCGGVMVSNHRFAFCLLCLIAINGVVISLVGILQKLTLGGDIFWYSQLLQEGFGPFGPFRNRNNGGGYLILCLAAAIGVVYWLCGPKQRPSERNTTLAESVRELFADLDGKRIMSFVAVVILLAGVAATCSRGAIIAATLASFVGIGTIFLKRSRNIGVSLGLVSFGLVFSFLLWVGQVDPILEQLSTLGTLEVNEDLRVKLWSDSLKLVPDFWLLGTGAGTFRYAHLMVLSEHLDSWCIHAENQFVETIVELGLCGTVILLAVLALVFVRCLKLISARDLPAQSLGLVGVIALTGQVVSNSFDFGLTVPANMLLMAALCGMLVHYPLPASSDEGDKRARPSFVAMSFVLIGGLAGLLYGMPEFLSQRLIENSGSILRNEDVISGERNENFQRAWQLARSAERWSQGSLDTLIVLAELEVIAYRREAAQPVIANNRHIRDRFQAWPQTTVKTLHQLATRLRHQSPNDEQLKQLRETSFVKEHLSAARDYFVQARSACPLFAIVHYRLAQLDVIVGTGNEESTHLERVLRCHPSDASFNFWVGELADISRNDDVCVRYWNASLMLSNKHLQQIVNRALAASDRRSLLDVLPSKPQLLIVVAE